ncbi:hypothetical protein [Dubosiella newyorkensis]|uniref:hypothetical protein n=1 Tax=Dubosiella newyorkensis TaxID=1862672 RepID=UPI00272A4687|nr:hypothetical protein [Dubosiella newyorkensis]
MIFQTRFCFDEFLNGSCRIKPSRGGKNNEKIKQQEIMQRYIASRSGMYTWSVPTYSNTAKSPIKAFAFPAILKLCGLEDE